MEFKEAIQCIQEGKKVKRKGSNDIWEKDFGSGTSPIIKHQLKCLEFKDYEADDWEIFEEEKTLSDKIIPLEDVLCCDVVSIKEFIKKLKDFSVIRTKNDNEEFTIMEIPLEVLNKLAGDKLI